MKSDAERCAEYEKFKKIDAAFRAGDLRGAQAYEIPAASMLPTLAVGDHVYVTKLCYGAKLPFTDRLLVTFHQPKRGDIVVLKYPEDDPTSRGSRRCSMSRRSR